MKQKLLLGILMAVLGGKAFSQDGYTIKVGGTYASIRGEESEKDLGIALGIGREWQISKRMGLALELMYTAKKAVLRNKTVAHETYWTDGDGFDIHLDVRYVEIPFVWKYHFPAWKSLMVELHTGPSLELAIEDRSDLERLYSILSLQRDFKYDYVFAREPDPLWYGSSGLSVSGGVAIGWSPFTAELRYSKTLHDVHVIEGVAIREKLDFLQVLIGLRIK